MDHWDLLSETTGGVTTDYLVPNGLIHSFVRDGERYDCHADALGSIRTVTNSNGEVVAQLEFGAWGEQLDGSFDEVSGGMPFQWIGRYGIRRDATHNLCYIRQRWYDSELQRFISRDFLMTERPYTYCGNRPTDLVDTNGLEPTVPGGTWGTPLGGAEVGGGIYANAPSSYHNYGPGEKFELPVPEIPEYKVKKLGLPGFRRPIPKFLDPEPVDRFTFEVTIKWKHKPNHRPSPPPSCPEPEFSPNESERYYNCLFAFGLIGVGVVGIGGLALSESGALTGLLTIGGEWVAAGAGQALRRKVMMTAGAVTASTVAAIYKMCRDFARTS